MIGRVVHFTGARPLTSGLPPENIVRLSRHVRKVPKAIFDVN